MDSMPSLRFYMDSPEQLAGHGAVQGNRLWLCIGVWGDDQAWDPKMGAAGGGARHQQVGICPLDVYKNWPKPTIHIQRQHNYMCLDQFKWGMRDPALNKPNNFW